MKEKVQNKTVNIQNKYHQLIESDPQTELRSEILKIASICFGIAGFTLFIMGVSRFAQFSVGSMPTAFLFIIVGSFSLRFSNDIVKTQFKNNIEK